MQLFASLHVVFTCSFVFLLAYVLSRVFTYLAHSVIHGSHTSTTKGAQGSSRGRRSESLKAQLLEQDKDSGLMAGLQEEDEGEEAEDGEEFKGGGSGKEKGAYQYGEVSSTTAHTPRFDTGGGTFDEISEQEYELTTRDDGAECSKREGIIEGEGLDASDGGKYETREPGYRGISITDIINEGKGIKESEDAEAKEEKGIVPDKSVLGDVQGSGSMQQRLPPTWSELERMVNTNSQKRLVLPPVAQLPEYE